MHEEDKERREQNERQEKTNKSEPISSSRTLEVQKRPIYEMGGLRAGGRKTKIAKKMGGWPMDTVIKSAEMEKSRPGKLQVHRTSGRNMSIERRTRRVDPVQGIRGMGANQRRSTARRHREDDGET